MYDGAARTHSPRGTYAEPFFLAKHSVEFVHICDRIPQNILLRGKTYLMERLILWWKKRMGGTGKGTKEGFMDRLHPVKLLWGVTNALTKYPYALYQIVLRDHACVIVCHVKCGLKLQSSRHGWWAGFPPPLTPPSFLGCLKQ